MFYFDPTYFLIVGPIFALSFYVQNQLKSKFKKFSKQPLSANLTGKEVAEKMLNDHGIYDVKIISVKGQLSDHYNPQKKTVNLSESVYSKSNTAAVAVAAHECGHAVQHAKGYEWLKMRSILVPVVKLKFRYLDYSWWSFLNAKLTSAWRNSFFSWNSGICNRNII